MSHLTKIRTNITSRQAILDALESLNITPAESTAQIKFSTKAYGRTWKMSFTENQDGFTFQGESDFYRNHFLPGYINQVVAEKMSQIAQFTGKLTEFDRIKASGSTTIIYKSQLGQTINFVIDAATNIEVKTEGFTGTHCLNATAGIMAALGSIENQTLTTTPDVPDLLNQITY